MLAPHNMTGSGLEGETTLQPWKSGFRRLQIMVAGVVALGTDYYLLPFFFFSFLFLPSNSIKSHWIASHLSIECTYRFSLAKWVNRIWYWNWFHVSGTKFSISGIAWKCKFYPGLWTVCANLQYARWRSVMEVRSLSIFGCQKKLGTQIL